MDFDDDLPRIEGHIAEARGLVHRQRGLVTRLSAAVVATSDSQRILWLLEANLRRLENHRDWFRESIK